VRFLQRRPGAGAGRVLLLLGLVGVAALLSVGGGSALADRRIHRHRDRHRCHGRSPTRGGHPRPAACPRQPKNPAAQRRALAARRAVELYEAMQRAFFLPQLGLYREALNTNEPSFLWPFSQGFGATVAVAYLPGEQTRLQPVLKSELGGLQTYLNTRVPAAVASRVALQSLPHFNATIASLGEGETAFYDDNDWVGLELVRLYELTKEASVLALAEQVMQFEITGWDGTPSLPCPGGIPHSDNAEDPKRSTISTAPAAELAVKLYKLTGNQSYLQFARTAYAWVRSCLLNGEGLYSDHLEADGETDPEIWSYTQGVMIGAGALLYQATGEAAYLQQAEATSAIAFNHFPLPQLAVENPFFVWIYLRNQLYLDGLINSPQALAATQEYLNWAWENLLEGGRLVLSATGAPTVLLGQAAYVQLYALLALKPSQYL